MTTLNMAVGPGLNSLTGIAWNNIIRGGGGRGGMHNNNIISIPLE
jgi:hypothetical protein